jgi:hypothetical protein
MAATSAALVLRARSAFLVRHQQPAPGRHRSSVLDEVRSLEFRFCDIVLPTNLGPGLGLVVIGRNGEMRMVPGQEDLPGPTYVVSDVVTKTIPGPAAVAGRTEMITGVDAEGRRFPAGVRVPPRKDLLPDEVPR